MRSSKSIMTGVAVLAALALPMVAGAANKLVVNGTDGTTPKMIVTDSGYVGVGKTPAVALDVAGVPGAARLVAQTVGDSTIGGGSFIGLHSNAPTTNSGLPRLNDRIGFFLFGSRTGVSVSEPLGTTTVTGGGVQVYAEAAWTASSYPTYFTFETAPVGSVTKVERLRVTSNGNIGVGANAPTQKLEINGGLRLNPNANPVTNGNVYPAKPTCNATNRGTFWFNKGATGVADTVEVCIKTAVDAVFEWKAIW